MHDEYLFSSCVNILASVEPPMLTQRPGRPALSATEIDTVFAAHPASEKHFINVAGKDDIILGGQLGLSI